MTGGARLCASLQTRHAEYYGIIAGPLPCPSVELVRGATVGPLPPHAEVEVFDLFQSFGEILVQKDSIELIGCCNFLLVASDARLAVWAVPLNDPRRRRGCRYWLDEDADGVWKPLTKSEGAPACEDESSIAHSGQDGTRNPVAFRVGFGALDQGARPVHLNKLLGGDEMIILARYFTRPW